jgi:hypothetical protein
VTFLPARMLPDVDDVVRAILAELGREGRRERAG